MEQVPIRIPEHHAGKNTGFKEERFDSGTKVNRSMGKNRSFICSQVDSFMGKNGARTGLFPDHP